MYSIGSSSSHTSGALTSVPQAANRRVATGVLGVMRRAEERKRRQQLASTTAADYMLHHNMPETIDRILGQILASRPSDPLAMLEELLRQCDSDGSRKFGSSNGYVSEPTSHQGHGGYDVQPSGVSTSAQVKDTPLDLSEGGHTNKLKAKPPTAAAAEVVQGSRPPAPEDTDRDYYAIPNDDEDEDGH